MAIAQNKTFVEFCDHRGMEPVIQKLFAVAVESGCGIYDGNVLLDTIDVDRDENVTYVSKYESGVEFTDSVPLKDALGSFKAHMLRFLMREEDIEDL